MLFIFSYTFFCFFFGGGLNPKTCQHNTRSVHGPEVVFPSFTFSFRVSSVCISLPFLSQISVFLQSVSLFLSVALFSSLSVSPDHLATAAVFPKCSFSVITENKSSTRVDKAPFTRLNFLCQISCVKGLLTM